MIIVAGWLRTDAAARDAYVAGCHHVVEQARRSPGCLAYTIDADPLDPTRVNVYERWTGETPMLAFRDSGPDPAQQAEIVDASVRRYEISAVAEA